jgi:predicted membrane channel-forming protein YqfA (hemolysin III family)
MTLPRRLRMLAGGFFMLAWLIAYVVIAATIGGMLSKAPQWVSLVYYIVAGFGWVAPLKPLIAWMSRADAPSA